MIYKITKQTGGSKTLFLEEVEAEPITIGGYPCIIFEEYSNGEHLWNITCLQTGMQVTISRDKDKTIKIAEDKINANPEAVQKAKRLLLSQNIAVPVNNLLT